MLAFINLIISKNLPQSQAKTSVIIKNPLQQITINCQKLLQRKYSQKEYFWLLALDFYN